MRHGILDRTSEMFPQTKGVKSWAGASTGEIDLAKKLSIRIASSDDKSRQARELFELTSYLINGSAVEIGNSPIALHKTHAEIDCEVTSNLISQIAFEVERRDADVKLSGSYFTPYVLAADMVKVAAASWTKQQLLSDTQRELIDALWYDPCLGGGVFPVAIAEFLISEGLLTTDVPKHVTGADINPLFVEATKIRVALVLTKGKSADFLHFYELLQESFTCEDSLMSFSEEKNFFSSGKQKVDIVVGNPPYVRSNSITFGTKETLSHLYPSVSVGTADLYMFFIAHGLNALRENGVLCYISPATFQRTSSGLPIRSYISKHASIDVVFDFDELNVFENVSSHLCVYILSKSRQNKNTDYFLFDHLPQQSPLLIAIENIKHVSLSDKSGHVWNFNSESAPALIHIEKDTIPLHRYTQSIYSGIKTGLKSAYELNALEHREILSDVRSRPYIFPLLKPTQIERWSVDWQDTYQIVLKRKQPVDEKSEVYKHLLKFKDLLMKRTDLRNKNEWYSLRDCAYFDLFSKPKIVYRDISSTCRFAMDTKGMLVVDGGFFIPQEDYFLLGLLNSKVGCYYFKNKCATIGSIGSRARLRFKKVYVSEFPVPVSVTDSDRSRIADIAKQMSLGDKIDMKTLENELNELVLDLYAIPKETKTTILES